MKDSISPSLDQDAHSPDKNRVVLSRRHFFSVLAAGALAACTPEKGGADHGNVQQVDAGPEELKPLPAPRLLNNRIEVSPKDKSFIVGVMETPYVGVILAVNKGKQRLAYYRLTFLGGLMLPIAIEEGSDPTGTYSVVFQDDENNVGPTTQFEVVWAD